MVYMILPDLAPATSLIFSSPTVSFVHSSPLTLAPTPPLSLLSMLLPYGLCTFVLFNQAALPQMSA